MEELKPCPPFKRFTHNYEDGKAWVPAASLTFMGEGELAGAPIARLALYESLLQMEPAEAALKLRRAAPENKLVCEGCIYNDPARDAPWPEVCYECKRQSRQDMYRSNSKGPDT